MLVSKASKLSPYYSKVAMLPTASFQNLILYNLPLLFLNCHSSLEKAPPPKDLSCCQFTPKPKLLEHSHQSCHADRRDLRFELGLVTSNAGRAAGSIRTHERQIEPSRNGGFTR